MHNTESAEDMLQARFRSWLIRSCRLSEFNDANAASKSQIIEEFVSALKFEKAVETSCDASPPLFNRQL